MYFFREKHATLVHQFNTITNVCFNKQEIEKWVGQKVSLILEISDAGYILECPSAVSVMPLCYMYQSQTPFT